MGKVSALPYVEEHEVAEAQELIDKQFIELTGSKFGLRPAGYYIAVKIYVRPDELSVIDMPDYPAPRCVGVMQRPGYRHWSRVL